RRAAPGRRFPGRWPSPAATAGAAMHRARRSGWPRRWPSVPGSGAPSRSSARPGTDPAAPSARAAPSPRRPRPPAGRWQTRRGSGRRARGGSAGWPCGGLRWKGAYHKAPAATLAAAPVECAPMDAFLQERFAGIDRLYGVGAAQWLAGRRVAVVGLGGVGSWLVEALARSAVGTLVLVDADDLCVSNTNRQLPALEGQYGRGKAQVLAERCRAINPRVEARPVAQFLTAGNLESLLGEGFDLVVDACDSFRTKVEAIAWCRRRKQPVLTVGSAGGRTDPTLVRVRDLSRTEHDAMLALVRKKLRAEFGFPRNPQRFFGVPAVYSLE